MIVLFVLSDLFWLLIFNVLRYVNLLLLGIAGRSICMGKRNSRSHSWRFLLWVYVLSNSGWPSGRAFWCQVDHCWISWIVYSCNATDATRSSSQLHIIDNPESSMWHWIGVFNLESFYFNSAV